jgi:hypothetical protein
MRIPGATLAAYILILCSSCNGNLETSKGFLLDIAMVPESCGDGRSIVAIAMGKHRARLNEEPDQAIAAIAPRLHEVLTYRAEKIVYVIAEGDASWGDFLEVVDRVSPEAGVVSIITPHVLSLVRQGRCLATSRRTR